MKIKILSAGLTVMVLVALALSIRRVPQPAQFCAECVLAHTATDWQLAGWTFFTTEADLATPVSELLAERHACPPHQHNWSLPVHVAEADLETSEAPRIRSVGFLNEPRNVHFLREVFDYTDQECVANWRTVAWQPTFAAVLAPALRFERFPENGFASREEFRAWWNQSAYPLFNKLNEMTVAD